MGATTSLASNQLSVAPGDSVSCTVQVRNSGTLVDQYTTDIVGDAREWATVEPQVLNLMPGQVGEVTIRFAPPRDPSAPAGVVPFGVRVLSREEPAGSVVEEGQLNVEPFTNLQLELVPKTSHCRTKARHELVVDNAGNYPMSVELVPSDEEEQLKLSLDHTVLTIEPGTSAFLKLRAKPEDRFLRGPDRRHKFQVTALAGETPPIAVDGTVVQKQLLPKWLLPALLALIVLAIALVVLWFSLVRPTVQSAAREAAVEAAREEQKALVDAANAASEQAAAAAKTAQEAKAAAEENAGSGDPADGEPAPPDVVGPGGVDVSKGTAIDFRITTGAAETGNPSTFQTFEADPEMPADKTLVITDILLQNPRGDSGILQLRRNDQVLLEVGLNNFRDLDYHLIEPWAFAPGDKLVIAVNCSTAASGSNCRPAATFSGRLAAKAEEAEQAEGDG